VIDYYVRSSVTLHTLELRRLHLESLYCYKIVFGLVNVNFCDFFELSATTNTRGHKWRNCLSQDVHLASGKFFVDRVINIWNSYPSTVNFSTLTVFRNSIAEVDSFSFLVCSILPV